MFLFQSTFFVALMALHCRRQAANRHCLLIGCGPELRELRPTDSLIEAVCLRRPPTIRTKILKRRNAHGFFYKWVAKLLENFYVKVFTFLLYLIYLGVSIKWILKLPLGIIFLKRERGKET